MAAGEKIKNEYLWGKLKWKGKREKIALKGGKALLNAPFWYINSKDFRPAMPAVTLDAGEKINL